MHAFLLSHHITNMGFATALSISLLLLLPFLIVHGNPLVPALIIFGDSNVDPGNNNKLLNTATKANFLPYGRDFVTHKPTGRFTNGKLVTDFIAESLGFSSFPPAYLIIQEATGKDLLMGASFASASSGYMDIISESLGTMSLSRQLKYYREYQTKIVNLVGEAKANDILHDSIFLLCTGTADFVSYALVPSLKRVLPPDQFYNLLLISYSNFIQKLYALGARKIGVTNVPPTGCIPLVITALGFGRDQCIDSVNQKVISFNKELQRTTESLKNKLPGLRLMGLDVYGPFVDIINRPILYGISETRRGCCGSGLLESSSVLCNAKSVGTCPNATRYAFWDAVHPTEAVNKIMATNILEQGKSLIPPP